MRTILATLLTVLLLLPISAIGEIQTITHTVKQTFGGSQSPDDARISAIAKAKREVLEKAGTYIESITVVRNLQVDKDEILALAAGVLKAEVISQKNSASDDAFGIDVVVNVVVDTSVLEERVKKLLQDRTHLEQLNQARLREKVLLKKIAVLEGENRKSGKSKQKSANLKKEFQAASRGLTAVDWFNEALALWDGWKISDPKKAIEYLSNAIKLQPDSAAYNFYRGIAYAALGQLPRAIEDYNEAIRLEPVYANAWSGLGGAYRELKRYNDAIDAYRQVLSIDPEEANAWFGIGLVYDSLKRYNDAIDAYRHAVRIDPENAGYWKQIGFAYWNIKRYNDAIDAYRQALRINPKDTQAWSKLGLVYTSSGNLRAALDVAQELRRIDSAQADDLLFAIEYINGLF